MLKGRDKTARKYTRCQAASYTFPRRRKMCHCQTQDRTCHSLCLFADRRRQPWSCHLDVLPSLAVVASGLFILLTAVVWIYLLDCSRAT